MEISTFLNEDGWEANEEFDIKMPYENKNEMAHIAVYSKQDESLYHAQMKNGKELLLSPTNIDEDTGNVVWVSIDVKNLELATRIGDAIERHDR